MKMHEMTITQLWEKVLSTKDRFVKNEYLKQIRISFLAEKEYAENRKKCKGVRIK